VDRTEIEADARARARRREELTRRPALEAEVAELESRAGALRRLLARLAGSRFAGLLAGDRSLTSKADVGVAREAARLRQERFRLSRQRRVLGGKDAGAGEHTRRAARSWGPPLGEGGLSFCIRVAGSDWATAERGGDLALASSLARALGERGHLALVQLDQEADDPLAAGLDVLIALRGRPTRAPSRDRLNLCWLISHPEEIGVAELNRYDRVLVASTGYAATLADDLTVPVEPLLQFTDSRLFHPVPSVNPGYDVLFVGNWRGQFRQIVWDARLADRTPALYGEGWNLMLPQHAVAAHVPHGRLRDLYSSCKVLLVDHWEDMRRHGFVSNKIFDALACGAVVIADQNPGLAETVPGGVETYSSPTELRAKIDRYLADPSARERIARRGREIVLAEHTVDHRAEQLIAIASAALRECERPELKRPRERGAPAGDASAAAAARRAAGADEA
jgi:hypothetical protein